MANFRRASVETTIPTKKRNLERLTISARTMKIFENLRIRDRLIEQNFSNNVLSFIINNNSNDPS